MCQKFDGEIIDSDRGVAYDVVCTWEVVGGWDGDRSEPYVCDVSITGMSVQAGTIANPLAYVVGQPSRKPLWLDVEGHEKVCKFWFMENYKSELAELMSENAPPANAFEASHV